MKKIFTVALAVLMLLSLSACSAKKKPDINAIYKLTEFRSKGIDIYDSSMNGSIDIFGNESCRVLALGFEWDDMYAYDQGTIELITSSEDGDVYKFYMDSDLSNFWTMEGNITFKVIDNEFIKWTIDPNLYMIFEREKE